MEESMPAVYFSDLAQAMNLRTVTPEIDYTKGKIKVPDVNRPALQLTGYFEYFDSSRLQVIGHVEDSYISHMSPEQKEDIFEELLSYPIPGIVFCRDIKPEELFLQKAIAHKIPIFVSSRNTSSFVAECNRWLNVRLAPSIRIHGVLVDVFGEGVLITGESGIGKSEAALELVKRGHRLVSDDAVDIRKVSDATLVGSAPDITKHFIELRGIGVVDIKMMFGVSSVKDTQSIDLVIKLEDWDKEKEYDRIGLEQDYTEYLGNRVVCHHLPVRPGRNLAIIVESAAVNFRQKKMGYNAAEELYKRVQENMTKRHDDDDDEE
ncbi:MAG: HPr(Ser) kinase/phosphatase [Lachnospiraceae bacterium]